MINILLCHCDMLLVLASVQWLEQVTSILWCTFPVVLLSNADIRCERALSLLYPRRPCLDGDLHLHLCTKDPLIEVRSHCWCGALLFSQYHFTLHRFAYRALNEAFFVSVSSPEWGILASSNLVTPIRICLAALDYSYYVYLSPARLVLSSFALVHRWKPPLVPPPACEIANGVIPQII